MSELGCWWGIVTTWDNDGRFAKKKKNEDAKGTWSLVPGMS